MKKKQLRKIKENRNKNGEKGAKKGEEKLPKWNRIKQKLEKKTGERCQEK